MVLLKVFLRVQVSHKLSKSNLYFLLFIFIIKYFVLICYINYFFNLSNLV